MKIARKHFAEYLLLAAVTIVSILGFWDLYFGSEADPQPHHHLHLVTVAAWLFFLLFQLNSVARGDFKAHRKNGISVLLMASIVVAAVAFLSVLSAQRAIGLGRPDELLVQNVMVSLQFGLLIVLAFLFRKRREIHGSLMFSTLLLFGGIALFFALLSFVPMFRIEGPETFYRFGAAATTGLSVCIGVAVLLFLSAPRTRWPYLLAAGCLVLNDAINELLIRFDLSYPATKVIGSLNPILAFIAAFVIQFALLALLVLPVGKRSKDHDRRVNS